MLIVVVIVIVGGSNCAIHTKVSNFWNEQIEKKLQFYSIIFLFFFKYESDFVIIIYLVFNLIFNYLLI